MPHPEITSKFRCGYRVVPHGGRQIPGGEVGSAVPRECPEPSVLGPPSGRPSFKCPSRGRAHRAQERRKAAGPTGDVGLLTRNLGRAGVRLAAPGALGPRFAFASPWSRAATRTGSARPAARGAWAAGGVGPRAPPGQISSPGVRRGQLAWSGMLRAV
uniref:Uncharacterized protein n=1 Tax=Rangifer tarandus platyrhynchus TaxID=3082113 RepID=A0ACB0FHA2_RANTA|nr:unnamed protein product [Rangifer tarandus platyrhynchus]